ncbi:MAG TPA: response regulator [Gemmatimonadaceae bacterium]|nr:response regulator [Gemmatimonadaceae bacterium]
MDDGLGKSDFLNEPPGEATPGGDGKLSHVPEYRGTETILFVDDNAMFREFGALALRSYGYTVIEAADGEEAIAAIARFVAPIHLVVTDVIMPNLDGHDLVRTLRGWYPNIRVLFMSGYARGEAGVRDQADEATGFLAKPFHVNQLAATMRSLLDKRIRGDRRAEHSLDPEQSEQHGRNG